MWFYLLFFGRGFLFGIVAISAAQAADSISRRRWEDTLLYSMPPQLCHEHAYFRRCFAIKADECRTVIEKSIRTCLKNSETPAEIRFSQADTDRAVKVGECAGAAAEADLLKRKLNDWKCRDRRKWIY